WAVTDAAVRSASAPREPAVRAREPRRWSMSRGSKRSPRAGRIQRTRDIQVIAVRVHFPSRRRRVYARKAVLDGVGIHALRHAAITRLIERGVPVPIAQRSAGHADAPTTMRYRSIADDVYAERMVQALGGESGPADHERGHRRQGHSGSGGWFPAFATVGRFDRFCFPQALVAEHAPEGVRVQLRHEGRLVDEGAVPEDPLG